MSDDGDVVWTAQASLAQGVIRTNGQEIVGGNKSRDVWMRVQELVGNDKPFMSRVALCNVRIRVFGKSVSVHCPNEATPATITCGVFRGTGNMTDRPVAEADEMVNGYLHTQFVVRNDARKPRLLLCAIHQNGRDVLFETELDQGVSLADRCQDEAINASSQKASSDFELLVIVATNIGDDHGVALGCEPFAGTAEDGSKYAVGYVGNENCDKLRSPSS